MKYSKNTLDIFAAAATIFERLNQAWDHVAYPTENELSDYKERWAKILSKETGSEQLERFFKIEGITDHDLKRMFSSVRVNEKTEIPEWLDITERVVSLYENAEEKLEKQPKWIFDEDGETILWAELLLPWVRIYEQELQLRTTQNEAFIRAEVYTALSRSFLLVIANVAHVTLLDQLTRVKCLQSPSPLANSTNEISKTDYLNFINERSGKHFIPTLLAFPMLTRILSVLTRNVSRAHARFVNRLFADYTEIKATFFENRPIGPVINIKNSVSDFHKEGESVVLIKFESGEKLAYKPKNLDLAEHFNDLIAWINEQDTPVLFRQSKVVNKKSYGWVEYITFKECESEKEVEQYYLRAGALLCLCSIVEGTDLHYENIIAHGPFPVILDYETILSPRVSFTKHLASINAQAAEIQDSVTRTGLLPNIRTLYNVTTNFGGFGGEASPEAHELTYMEHEVNVPQLEGKRCPLGKYREVLKTGFELFYRFIETKKPVLLSAQSPLKGLNNLPVRVLFRNTYIYEYALKKLALPRNLKNGTYFSIQMEVLAKGLLKPTNKPISWRILDEERVALLNFDFPFFATTTSSADLQVNDNQSVEDFFQKPSYDAMIDQIDQMSETQLVRQLNHIDLALDQLYTESPAQLSHAANEVESPGLLEITN